MKIFDYSDYRPFVLDRIRAMPKAGRGELLKIAKHLEIHSSTLSQVLGGQKHFTLDQACSLANYFGMSDLETHYLFLLVQQDRAGTERLKATLKKQLQQLKKQSLDLSSIIPGKKSLSEEEKAVFYSNWYYSAIWAITSIDGYQSAEAISKYFALPMSLVNQVIAFLISTGLCIEDHGALRPGSTYVHLESHSPFIGRHHSNWRQKAMERHPILSETEIAYTLPMSLSEEDAVKIRRLIVDWIGEVNKIRDPSPCEALYFLNLDWIKL